MAFAIVLYEVGLDLVEQRGNHLLGDIPPQDGVCPNGMKIKVKAEIAIRAELSRREAR